MLDLALNSTSGPVASKDIAVRQEISEDYLENPMGALIAQGLVRGIPGKRSCTISSPEAIRGVYLAKGENRG